MGAEAAFRGVIDLLDDTRHPLRPRRRARRSPAPRAPSPTTSPTTEHEVHEQLVEGIVVGDDDLMDRYLDGETIDRDELEATLAGGVASGPVFPVLCCSAATGVGIDRLARLLVEIGPAPDQRPPVEVRAGDTTTEVACDPAGPPLAGGLQDDLRPPRRADLAVQGAVGDAPARHRAHQPPDPRPTSGSTCSSSCGATRPSRCNEAVAGDFVAVPRLSDTATGDTLAPKGTPVPWSSRAPEPPALSVAVRPASRADEDKLMSGLHDSARRTRPCVVDPGRRDPPDRPRGGR